MCRRNVHRTSYIAHRTSHIPTLGLRVIQKQRPDPSILLSSAHIKWRIGFGFLGLVG